MAESSTPYGKGRATRPFLVRLRSLIAFIVFVALVVALVVQERKAKRREAEWRVRLARMSADLSYMTREREIAEINLEDAKAEADLRAITTKLRAQKTVDQRVGEER